MIIGNPIMAGVSGPFASIFVTGLSETDTVTAVHKKTVQVPNPAFHGLPDGYTELEYIESSGTQYIDTGLITSSNRYKIETNLLWKNGDGYFGADYGYWFGLTSDLKFTIAGNFVSSSTASLNKKYNIVHEIDSTKTTNNYSLKVDDVSVLSGSFSNFQNGKMYALFAIGQSTSTVANYSSAKCYSESIWVNDVLVRNFVPAKRNSDNAIGMYDLVSSTFYTNAGSGTFTAGAEIPTYIETVIEDKTLTGKWTTIQKMVDAQIPTMTSNTTPSGVVSSTSDYSDEYSAWKAFDGKETSTPGWAPSTDADLSNTYCQYEFNESINPKEIRIGFGGNGFTFDVKASSDGVNFVTLASNISNSKDAWSIVNVESDEYYKYYRFYMINATVAPSSGYGQKFNIIGTKLGAVNGHMIKPIRDFGTWTVTATNGEKTATQDVMVDVITEYEIEMSLYKLWLYRNGDECEDVTGGWTANGYSTGSSTLQEPTKNNDSVTLYCNTNNYISFVGTVNPISFKGYSKLKCCTKNVSINGKYAGGTISFDVQKISVDNSSQYVFFVRSSEETECEIDISEYQGTYFVCAKVFNATSKADLTKVWLE